jgi:hypothetical protein
MSSTRALGAMARACSPSASVVAITAAAWRKAHFSTCCFRIFLTMESDSAAYENP